MGCGKVARRVLEQTLRAQLTFDRRVQERPWWSSGVEEQEVVYILRRRRLAGRVVSENVKLVSLKIELVNGSQAWREECPGGVPESVEQCKGVGHRATLMTLLNLYQEGGAKLLK